jgi:hypothetical protein
MGAVKYRDFINRYPTSDQADYAMLRIGMCSFKQMEQPTAIRRRAKSKLNDVLRAHRTARFRGRGSAGCARSSGPSRAPGGALPRRGSQPGGPAPELPHRHLRELQHRAGAFYDLGMRSHLGRAGASTSACITEFPKATTQKYQTPSGRSEGMKKLAVGAVLLLFGCTSGGDAPGGHRAGGTRSASAERHDGLLERLDDEQPPGPARRVRSRRGRRRSRAAADPQKLFTSRRTSTGN